MPRLAICSRDLHWHWINRTLLCDTMEVSMLSRAWLTIAQHVFQPVLTGGPELISRKIVSGEPGTKAIAVSRFREKLSPANWVQGVTVISRKISRSWAPKKWGPTCDRDISNSAIYTTAIYRAYTVLIEILSNCVPIGQTDNMSALVHVMVWCWIFDKPWPEPKLNNFHDVIGLYLLFLSIVGTEMAEHREITPTGLCGPRFHAPLHIFPLPPGPAGSVAHHRGKGRSLAAFNVTFLLLVLEIRINF